MPSYFITGVARDLGFEYIRQLSKDPENTVIGLVRDKAATDAKISGEFPGRKNLQIIEGDLMDYESLKKGADFTAEITGGALDYVIANAALTSNCSAYLPIGKLGKEPKKFEKDMVDLFKVNVVGSAHLFNLFIPLVLKGKAKKIIAMSTGFAFTDLSIKYQMYHGAPYTISKVALNALVAKFHTQYAPEGILFMTISPGLIDTGNAKHATPAEKQLMGEMFGKFMAYAPHFKGPSPIDEAAGQMLDVLWKANVEGDGGTSVSQFGNTTQWL